MTKARSREPVRLTDEQRAEVMELASQSDSVELKLTVPDSERGKTVAALGMDPLNAQIRQVFFFDTADLDLNKSGVVARARRIQGKGDDSVVKLRPVVPADIDEERRSSHLGVEVDAMPGGFVCSASLSASHGSKAVKKVAAGSRPISSLFTDEQQAFYRGHAPEGLGLDDLSVLGPITLLKLKFSPKEYDGKLVAELWFYPDGSRILELSTKAAPADAFTVADELRAFLGTKGLDLSGDQQTKTKTALEFFAANLS